MNRKKIRSTLVVCIVCFTLILGQLPLYAAVQEKPVSIGNTVLSTRAMLVGYVTKSGVAVRTQPNTTSTRLGLLYSGDYIYIESSSAGWVYGYTNTGIRGYVSEQLLDIRYY